MPYPYMLMMFPWKPKPSTNGVDPLGLMRVTELSEVSCGLWEEDTLEAEIVRRTRAKRLILCILNLII